MTSRGGRIESARSSKSDTTRLPLSWLSLSSTSGNLHRSRRRTSAVCFIRLVEGLYRPHPRGAIRSQLRRGGHCQVAYDGSIHAGSPLIESLSLRFTPRVVGEPVFVLGAGAHCGPLVTVIRSILNGTQTTLAEPASTSVRNAFVVTGADDASALQAAIDRAGARGGGTVYLPSGTFRVSRTLLIAASQIRLTGDGPNSIIVTTALTNRPTIDKTVSGQGTYHLVGGWAASRAILIGAVNKTISNIEIDHLAVVAPPVPWVQSNIGQALVMTGTDERFRVTNFSLHDTTFTSPSLTPIQMGDIWLGFPSETML